MAGKSGHGVPKWSGILVLLCLLVILTVSSCTLVGSPTPVPTAPPTSTSVLPSLSQVVNKVLPSVVYIFVETTDTNLLGPPVKAAGSGVILRPNGYILTNRHVAEKAKRVEITLHDRRVYSVSNNNISNNNIWIDDIVDLAVVKIEERNLPVLQFADPDNISVGDWVMAVGHALGLSPLEGGAAVTGGIVSNLGRSFSIDTTSYYDLIQTDAAINPGNSGGPLVNMAGDVIGINSAEAPGAQSIGFAINVGTARHVFEDLVQYGKPHHPYLGATLGDITPDIAQRLKSPRVGTLITNIEPRSPAELAGLHKDDVIILFGKEQIDTAASLIKEIWRHEPGDAIEVVFWRGGMEMKISITLGERPQTDAV